MYEPGRMCRSGGLTINLTIFFHPTISNLKIEAIQDSALLPFCWSWSASSGCGELMTKVRHCCAVIEQLPVT